MDKKDPQILNPVIANNEEGKNFTLAFATFVIKWNHLEGVARDIMQELIGAGYGSLIAVHHMGNASLTDAIRVSSSSSPAMSEHLVHFCKGMDVLRAYRNYYVHGLIGVGMNDDHGAVGLVLMLQVKGRVKLTEKALQLDDLMGSINDASSYISYGKSIVSLLGSSIGLDSLTDKSSSLKKPLQPQTLEKRTRIEPAALPPPQSSQA